MNNLICTCLVSVFFSSQISAQKIIEQENFHKSIENMESSFNKLLDSVYVLLAEIDVQVSHKIDINSTQDSLIYSTEYFEDDVLVQEKVMCSLLDVASITIEINDYTDSRTHLIFRTKMNRAVLITNDVRNERNLSFTTDFYVPVQSNFLFKDLEILQTSLVVVKTELIRFRPSADLSKIKSARFHVKEAVLQNLLATRPNIEKIRKLSQNSKLFVTKCQICLGVQDALKEYLNIASPEDEMTIQFDTDDFEQLFDELQQFVSESMDFYLLPPNFNDAEIELIAEKIKQERMSSISNFNIESCASCDGSCKAN